MGTRGQGVRAEASQRAQIGGSVVTLGPSHEDARAAAKTLRRVGAEFNLDGIVGGIERRR